jgi:hypothetical protein
MTTTKSSLANFSKNVATNRQTFFRGLNTLPREFETRLSSNYKNRIARANGKPLLGEYAPWLLVDLLPLNNPKVALRIAPAWMNLYAYTLFVDDMLDTNTKNELSKSVLASGLLLERGISALTDALPKDAKVRVKLDRYFLEAATATFKEITKHRERLSRYSQKDISRLGEKVALLKLCASCLLAADGAKSISNELLVPIESLATGAQLFDDVTDWQEDWRAGNYTYLLTRTFQRLKNLGIAREPSQFSQAEVLIGIVITGSLEDCLRRGLGYLNAVETSSYNKVDSVAKRLLEELIHENSIFQKEVFETRRFLEQFRTSYKMKTKDWLKEIRQKKPVQKQITIIAKRLKILAQST